MKRRALLTLAVLGAAGSLLAWSPEWGTVQRVEGFDIPDDEDWFDSRGGLLDWSADDGFQKDGFTFVRVIFDTARGNPQWAIDSPDSELNFSYRLQELTTIRTNPHPRALRLTDPRLRQYPFIYIVEPAPIQLTPAEAAALRAYLLQGGFLMVDDFWGERQWESFYEQIKKVFPDREPAELPPEHPIFHCVFSVERDQLQTPGIESALRSRSTGVTWEGRDGEPRPIQMRGIHDDAGRLCAIFCHNTDFGDGWERDGIDEWYFREFSEKRAYPIGINIVFYAMTH